MSSAYIGVKEVRGQMPKTTCNGTRTKSAINNSLGLWKRSTEPKPQGTEARRQSLAPQYTYVRVHYRVLVQ